MRATENTSKRLLLLIFSSCLTTMALSGYRGLQQIAMILTVGLTGFVVVHLIRSSSPNSVLRWSAYVLAGGIGFAAWNLFTQPNTRWAHRAFIYTIYGASVALFLLATELGKLKRPIRDHWMIAGGIYAATTVSILLLRPCFAERMMSPDGNSSQFYES